MRPTDVVKMLRYTRLKLQPNAYGPVNIMPVAGIDPGTLEDRYLDPAFRGADSAVLLARPVSAASVALMASMPRPVAARPAVSGADRAMANGVLREQRISRADALPPVATGASSRTP